MTGVRHGLDFAIDVVTSGLWAMAAFFVVARLISEQAGMLVALAIFVSTLTFIITSRVQERRARQIAAGACPRCQAALASDHEHRRWDGTHQEWLSPLTTWRCAGCGFQQEAPLACEACPTPA